MRKVDTITVTELSEMAQNMSRDVENPATREAIRSLVAQKVKQ